MKSLINYALAYAEMGFYVLPMDKTDKKPRIEFADRDAMTSDQIRRFWELHPTSQIALRTVDFFVVDIDIHNENGFESISNYENKELLVPTLSQTTGSGGKQLFYKKPKNIEVKQNIGWMPGVDIKAHINNYVMIAPSQITGKKPYQWDNKLPMAEASLELINDINSLKRGKKRDTSFNHTEYQNFTGQKSATSELFEQIINGLGATGGRNNALASFIGGLLFRNVDVEATYQLAKLANKNTEYSLDEREFERTFDSMVSKELRRRGVT